MATSSKVQSSLCPVQLSGSIRSICKSSSLWLAFVILLRFMPPSKPLALRVEGPLTPMSLGQRVYLLQFAADTHLSAPVPVADMHPTLTDLMHPARLYHGSFSRKRCFLGSILVKVDAVARGNLAVWVDSFSTNISGAGSA